MDKNKWVATFGSNHRDHKGMSLANRFVVLEAEDANAAADMMFQARGPKWSMMYDYDGFQPQVVKFNLEEISLQDIELSDEEK